VVCAPFAQLERKPFKQDHRQTGKRCIPVDRCAASWRDCRARIAGSDTPNREPWRTGNRTPRPCLLRASGFRYAVATGRAERDPTGDLRGALPPVKKDKHFAAITEPKKVGELMRDIDGYHGSYIVKCAFKLSPLLFVRPGELRKMEWKDLNLDSAEWCYFITKTETQHIVPLARQAVEVLREIQPLTGRGKYVFHGERDHDRPMSDNAIRSALRRMGWANDEMTPHGFRAMASTILDNMGYKQEWLERQLAHEEPNKVKAAYKRESWRMYLPERTAMMQAWADYLDGLKAGTDVIPLRAKA
jgi:integrase